jgi:hypothetical protein
MNRLVALFSTTRACIKTEKLCKQNSIICKVVPVPRELSSECGIAIEFDSLIEVEIRELFEKELITAKLQVI